MNSEELMGLAERLETHNRWRRGDWDDDLPPISTPQLGMDLDAAVKAIRESADAAWNTADKLPQSGQIVLARYLNDHGMQRIVRAAWVAANTEEANSDTDDFGIYCESDDTFYWPEGWYEQIDNWEDYSAVLINHEVTHWRHMPRWPA